MIRNPTIVTNFQAVCTDKTFTCTLPKIMFRTDAYYSQFTTRLFPYPVFILGKGLGYLRPLSRKEVLRHLQIIKCPTVGVARPTGQHPGTSWFCPEYL
jgi:hypothetical protein